jgi:tripartite ATP-independent transporter DctP family solute receptor
LLFFTTSVAFSSGTQSAGQKGQVQTINLKYAFGDPPSSPDGLAAQMLADKIKERSNGAIELTLYPSEQLGGIPEMLEGVQLGTIDITNAPSVTFTSYSPVFGISGIPYLFRDNNIFSKLIIKTGLADKQHKVLEENGMTVLNLARNYFKGPYRVLFAKKPIRSLDDFTGLRFRSFGNKRYVRAYETLGANPIVIPWSEVYMSLKQGIVEAGACNMSQLRGMNFTEVAPYVTRTNEYYSNVLFVMNTEKFNSLTPEHQRILMESCDSSFADLQKLQKEALDEDIDWMKANHGAVFSQIDTNPIREKLKDYYYELEKEGVLPKGTVDSAFSVSE